MLILPQLPHELMTAQTKKEKFAIRMSILRVRYRKFIQSDPIDKDSFVDGHVDLFVQNDDHSVSSVIQLIFIIFTAFTVNIFGAITFYYVWNLCGYLQKSDPNGHYIIFEG